MAEREEGDVCRSSSLDSDSHHRGDEKKPLSRPDSTTSGHNAYIASSSADVHNTNRPDLLVLKLDERQRLARERREEREKQNAMRESQLLEREERARLYYERQLEVRRRRLEEQRLKEERRRAAVEEKRRQKLEEEKARYEAVVRRTLEKSQRVRPKPNRWSWGGTLTSSASHNSGFSDSALLFTLDLAGLECDGAYSSARQQRPRTQYADRRSVSTMNLSKHIDPVISKRLSSSSATLLNTPDRGLQKQTSLSSSCLVNRVSSKARASREKIHQDRPAGMRRLPLTAWENNVVSRLQTPTHSYLARSRSAMSLCADAASCHQTSSLSLKALQSRSAERPFRAGPSLERAVRAGPDGNTCRKAANNLLTDRKDKDYVRKSWSNLSCPTPTLSIATTKRAPSPGSQRVKGSQLSPAWSSTKPPPKSPVSKKSRSPPPPPSMPLSPSNPSLLSGNLRPSRVTSESAKVSPEVKKPLQENKVDKREATEGGREEDEEAGQEKREEIESPSKAAAEMTRKTESNGVERVSSPPGARTSTGTTDPEEASRLMAEKRRQAREQREREEEDRRQQEEAERRHREEMARRIAEERAKREEEAQRLAEEKKCKEEEEKRLEEERVQREKEEEAERLQRQKEEEEARQREEADRLQQEREKHFQKEEAERLERKKRLEEIMKRTRRSDQKSPGQSQRNGDVTQQNSQDAVVPGIPSITVSAPPIPPNTQHNDSNGHVSPDLNSHTLPPAGHEINTEVKLQENGVIAETPTFEEVIEVPMVSKLSRQEGDGEEEDERRKTPLLAFRENGSTHDLSTWDQSQVQQNTSDV